MKQIRSIFNRLQPHSSRQSQPGGRSVTYFILVILTLLAWGLRLHRLDAQSLWYDEGVTATLAQRSLVDLTQWTAHDIQPPLYYYVTWGWGRLAGWSEWSLRFVSAWWGVLAIPVLATLSHRLTGRRSVALLVGLLTALHPLLVYYSQEARMYTMLVTLGALAGYALVRIDDRNRSSWRAWLIYVLVATAAVYTHYFAFFLLMALGCAFLLDRFVGKGLAVARHDPHLHGFIVTHLLILLLYLAWIAPLFQQLRTDASYWQGQLKMWEALRSLALRFTSGETRLEEQAAATLRSYAILTCLLLLVLVWHAHRNFTLRRALLYTLCWLALPLGGVLGLAAFVPKFNARYGMIALPGLLLLWGAGIGLLVEGWLRTQPTDDQRTIGRFLTTVGCIGGMAAVLFLGNNFRIANVNWFTDAAFTKAQWRELTRYLRAQHQVGEAIVLVSGHAWPIWDYYAPDLPAIRLPALEILDVNAVLDFANTGELLRTALQGKKGAWLVNWQDEVVDPNGIAPRQLQLAGREQPVAAEFWQLHLRHFVDLDPARIETTPPMDRLLHANFDDQLHLQGYGVTADDDLLLFWQQGSALPSPAPDLHLNLRTMTAGLLYTDPADQRPADYNLPVMRWQPGQLVMGRIPASIWAGAGALPGLYQVQLGVYDPAGAADGLDVLDPAGNPVGKFVLLDVTLAQATPPDPLAGAEDDTEILDGIRLTFPAERVAAEPGQAVPVTFHWFLEKKLVAEPELRLQWRLRKDGPIAASIPLSMTAVTPMTAWPAERWLRQVIAVQPPPTLPPGDYLLEILAIGRDNPARRPFIVLPSRRNFTTPPLAVTLAVNFGLGPGGTNQAPPQIRLLGLPTTFSTTLTANHPITLNFVWQSVATTAPVADYLVTLQLLGDDGLPVTQVDQALPGGSTSWLTGQIEEQSLTLVTPTQSGRYRLIVALYQVTPGGYPRLVTDKGDDFVTLGLITVTP